MAALSAQNLHFAYPGAAEPTFSGLGLNVPAGAVTAVLGPNGSGKTTLLYLFLGLLKPISGSVGIFGRDCRQYGSRALRQMIGLVPQNETVPFDLSLTEYVLLGRAPFFHLLQTPGDTDRAMARRAIRTVGMARLAFRRVPTLSGGERQLAAAARVLCQEPKIMLMDEPTSHLDLANARRVLHLMRPMAEQGRTVVFTTHDPNAAAAVADHVVLLGRGRLLAAGRPDDTLTGRLLSATYGETVTVVRTCHGPVVRVL